MIDLLPTLSFWKKLIPFYKKKTDSLFGVIQLAEQLKINRTQLTRMLLVLSNHSPAKLISNSRMEYAKQMLHSNSHSIEEIADKSGFNGISSFSRKFKQEYGINPSDYRKNELNNISESVHWQIPFSEDLLKQLFLLKEKNSWLTNFFDVIIENFDNESFSIEELAGKLYMSPSNLNRKIQFLFGRSTGRLVRDLRLQYAAELLALENKSVTEVASLSGFFDAAHLSRYFKRNFGCPPGEFKNKSLFFFSIEKLKD